MKVDDVLATIAYALCAVFGILLAVGRPMTALGVALLALAVAVAVDDYRNTRP